jgi:hypothetical protein
MLGLISTVVLIVIVLLAIGLLKCDSFPEVVRKHIPASLCVSAGTAEGIFDSLKSEQGAFFSNDTDQGPEEITQVGPAKVKRPPAVIRPAHTGPPWCNKGATTSMERYTGQPAVDAWLNKTAGNIGYIQGLSPMKWKSQSQINILLLHTVVPKKQLTIFNSNEDPTVKIDSSRVYLQSKDSVSTTHGLSPGDEATILIYSEHNGVTRFYIKQSRKETSENGNVGWWHGVDKSYSAVPCHMWWHQSGSGDKFQGIIEKI